MPRDLALLHHRLARLYQGSVLNCVPLPPARQSICPSCHVIMLRCPHRPTGNSPYKRGGLVTVLVLENELRIAKNTPNVTEFRRSRRRNVQNTVIRHIHGSYRHRQLPCNHIYDISDLQSREFCNKCGIRCDSQFDL